MSVGKGILVVTAMALTGCSNSRLPEHAAAPLAPPAAPAALAWARPLPPPGAAASFAVPARGADGRYLTPNAGLSDADTLWHVRMALNVAALSCRNDPTEAARANYVRLLSVHRSALDQANRTVDAQYRSKLGGQAMAARDTHNTRAYNFFALPPVQARFCDAAVRVSAAAVAMSAAELTAFAPDALAQLEQPFTDFFDAFTSYKSDLARWDKGERERYAMASAPVASVAVAPVVVAPVGRAPPAAIAAPAPAPVMRQASVAPREGGYVVQLSAFSAGDAAQTIWSDLVARHRLIANLPVVQSSAKVSGVTMHRLAVAGFATQAEASRTCAALKADGGSCFVRARLDADTPARWASAAI